MTITSCPVILRSVFFFLLVMHLPAPLFSKDFHQKNTDTLKFANTGWKRNAQIISLGFGVPNALNDRLNPANPISANISSINRSLIANAKFEFFLLSHFGLGATINYGTVNYIYTRETGPYYLPVTEKTPVKTEIVSLNLRFNYHLFYYRTIDVYLGGATGIRLVKTHADSNTIPDLYQSGAFREHELSLGLRYFAQGIVGMYAEVGLGRSFLQVGLNCNIRG